MKIYVGVENGKPVETNDGCFIADQLKRVVEDEITSDVFATGTVPVQMHISKYEKGGSLPEGAIKCYAILSGKNKFVLCDGVIMIANKRNILAPMTNVEAGETVVRAVLY
jgi:hypothetical protein